MIVRSAGSGDMAGIRGVSIAAGQPESGSGADAEFVRLLLATGSVVVAEDRPNDIVGWGAVRDGRLGSMLTDLFVAPHRQGRGIGRALLSRLWNAEAESSRRYTFSSQHPHALPVYLRAGLIPRWPLLYLRGRRREIVQRELHAERLPAEAAAAAERDLVGDFRKADYRFWTRGGGTGVLVFRGAQPVAVGAIRDDEVVHLACPDPMDAPAALGIAVAACTAAQVRVCVPGSHGAAAQLVDGGFQSVAYDLAMSSRGLDLPTGWIYDPGLG